MIRLYYCLLLMGSNSLYYARIYNINLGGKKNNMGAIEILLISIGLAMDAFAVSVCKGLAMKKMNWKKAAIIGLYFGIFQAVMPVIGYFLGTTFEKFITYVDHWVAFILLVGIGINMVKDAPWIGHGLGSFEAHYMDYQANFFKQCGQSRFSMLADNV